MLLQISCGSGGVKNFDEAYLYLKIDGGIGMSRVKKLSVIEHSCTAKVGADIIRWRLKIGDMNDRCENPATLVIDDRHYCKRHASTVALRILMEEPE